MTGDTVVVIGGGTSGSIVARTVASRTGRPVVLVEPGGRTDDDVPRFMDLLQGDALLPGEPVPQARALGGGSAVNGMILSGPVPGWLEGLVSTARPMDAGAVGRALLGTGGRLSTLWWNNGRWNPARSVLHAEEEGRIRIIRSAATSIRGSAGRALGVVTADGEIACGHLVLCAGALVTPRLLHAAGVAGPVGSGLQNHPTVSFTVPRPGPDRGTFDACVVRDLHVDGAVGLMIAFERLSATEPDSGLVTVSLMNPVSRGTVLPHVDFSFLSDPADRRGFGALMEAAREVLQQSGLVVTAESGVHGVSHPTSSCSLVTDTDGNVEGLGNVTVADASVLRSVPPETPAASVTIEARRIALALSGRLA